MEIIKPEDNIKDIIKIFAMDPDELKIVIEENDIILAESLLDKIKYHFKNTKIDFVPTMKIALMLDHLSLIVYDIGVFREEFASVLEKNIRVFEEHEMFEKCVEVKNLINQINKS